MATEFAVFADGLEVDLLEGLDSKSRRTAAYQAINQAARDARSAAAREITDQVNLPARYVSPGQKRLYVSKKAQTNSLEARITARGRATSLAQFVQGGARRGQEGVYVEIAPGKARYMKRAFVIPLRRGNQFTDTNYNLGLAVRLGPGEKLRNKMRARRVESGLYLLYGPSVSQIFRANDGSGVAQDMAPEVAKDLTSEFLRLLDRKNGT